MPILTTVVDPMPVISLRAPYRWSAQICGDMQSAGNFEETFSETLDKHGASVLYSREKIIAANTKVLISFCFFVLDVHSDRCWCPTVKKCVST